MRICYNKLQKLMIDNQMKRQDLMRAADISSYTATKINKNEPVCIVAANEYVTRADNKELLQFIRKHGKVHAGLTGTTDYAYSGLLYKDNTSRCRTDGYVYPYV